MGFKKLLVIVGVVLGLLVLVLVNKSAQKKYLAKQESAPLTTEFELIKDLPETFISGVVVYKGDDEKIKIVLVKNPEGVWILESKYGIKAKKASVDNLLKELKGLKGEVRAESKDLFADFKIEDSKALHILIEAGTGNIINHLVVSFLKPDWNKTFVRQGKSEKVVLVNKDILSLFNLYSKEAKLDDTYFADLKLFAFETKQIQKIELVSDKEQLIFKKSQPEGSANPVWNFEPALAQGEEIDTSKVDELLRNISNIYAKEILDPSLTTYGLDTPSLKVTLQDPEGKIAAQMEVGKYLESEKAYYVRVIPANLVFKVTDFYIQNLKKERASFLKPKETKKN
jgi:hypothetical protein